MRMGILRAVDTAPVRDIRHWGPDRLQEGGS